MNQKEIHEIIKKYDVTDSSMIHIEDIPNFNLQFKKLPSELYYLYKLERKHPSLFYPQAKSIIMTIFQYWNPEINYDEILLTIKDPYKFIKSKYSKANIIISKKAKKVARYILVDEYHKSIRKILNDILNEMKNNYNDLEGKIFVDTSPIFEKKIAELSSLGFIGKNTLLISPNYGSYVFLGGIIVNKRIENIIPRKKIKKLCSNCNICIKLCPTKALSENGLEQAKCISFWTTHTKRNIPKEIVEVSNYMFGCDICQEVCPFNKKAKKAKSIFYNKKEYY
ncbi:MAG: DUF1730 domain-containing protein [Elusimicrobiales bacterium]|nr:DUF1730 domain-containing protein [Elusimicrobiales bacterium]